MKENVITWQASPEEWHAAKTLVRTRTGIEWRTDLPAAAEVLQPIAGERTRLMLEMIDRASSEAIRETAVRVLAAAAEPFDFTPLMKEYDTVRIANDTDHLRRASYRWAIANTMYAAKPTNDIRQWIISKLLGPPCSSKQMLLLAAGKHLKKNPPEEEIISTFSEHPLHAAAALGKIGGEKSLRFLRAQQQRGADQFLPEIRRRIELSTERVIEGRESLAFLRKRIDADARGAVRAIQKEIEKSIAKIEKRLEKHKERDRRRKVGP